MRIKHKIKKLSKEEWKTVLDLAYSMVGGTDPECWEHYNKLIHQAAYERGILTKDQLLSRLLEDCS